MLQDKTTNRVMEAETIQKNAACLKSQMSRGNFLKKMCFVLLTAVFIFSGCANNEGLGTKDMTPTLRYETVPYGSSAGANLRSDSETYDNLVFKDYDDEYNYYFFVLGHINSVPLAYRPAIYYNGVTPVTVGYSSSNVTETSVSNSLTKAFEYSLTTSQSTSWGNEIEGKTSIKTGIPFLAEGKIEASYKHSWGGSDGMSETNSRSFSNTYETSSKIASEIKDEISVTIGNNNEPTGLYRYSLFSITDVYYVVTTDRAKTRIVEANVVFCARPTQYWKIDYDPEENGSFGKTASGALLQIPEIVLSQLPDVNECIHNWGAWTITTAPTDTNDGEETRTCSLCQRTEKRPIPTAGKEYALKILFNDYKISATTSKDYFCVGWYWMGIEIGQYGGSFLAKYPTGNDEYHYYGKYDDNLKNNKTVIRTYSTEPSQANVIVDKTKPLEIKFKVYTEAHRYWWTIVAIFGGKVSASGEKTVIFDYNQATDTWVARGAGEQYSASCSTSGGEFTFTHTFNYSINKQ